MKIKVSESMRKVTQPEGIYKLLGSYFKSQDGIDRKKEHFFVIHLDARNRVKFLELVSIGILNASLVHPREVFCRAVRECSSQIILAHNHPSGDTDPSHEDIAMTRRLSEAGRILGIELIDHIIFTDKAFCSLKEQNLF
jgi:DNA repair protein RadC